MAEARITCPKCGHRILVTKALAAQVEAGLRKEYDAQLKLQKRQAASDLKVAIDAEKERLTKVALRQAKTEARHDVSQEMAALRREMKAKQKEILQAQRKEADLSRKEGLLASKEKSLQATIEKQVQDATRKTEEETAKVVAAQYRDRELQFRKTETDLKEQLREATRKLEQGSQQMQGEIEEVELEKLLRSAFPSDQIAPVPSGRLGADIVQTVVSPSGALCGRIIWESKKTKTWQSAWLTKLKNDQRAEKADVAVLVSAALPKEVACRFGQISGVWVASLDLAQPLALALRSNLIELARLRLLAHGKPDKMELLYEYLMSVEFRQRVEAIVESFAAMREDLEKERQASQRQWAKRETQIRLVMENFAGAIGDIQAIAPAFPKIRRLELPPPDPG